MTWGQAFARTIILAVCGVLGATGVLRGGLWLWRHGFRWVVAWAICGTMVAVVISVMAMHMKDDADRQAQRNRWKGGGS